MTVTVPLKKYRSFSTDGDVSKVQLLQETMKAKRSAISSQIT